MESTDLMDRIAHRLSAELETTGQRKLIVWIIHEDDGVFCEAAVLFDRNCTPKEHTLSIEISAGLAMVEKSNLLPKDWFGVEWVISGHNDYQINHLTKQDLPPSFNLLAESLYNVIVAKHQWKSLQND
jgi:hypothetical protein